MISSCMFWPPGWSHDGSTLTIKQIRYEMATAEWGLKSQKCSTEFRLGNILSSLLTALI
jgi:hypothetical protein